MQGAGHLLLGLSPALVLATLATLAMGYGNGLETVTGTTLMQRYAAAHTVGAVLGTVVSASFVADALGSLVGGPLVDAIGARPVFAVSAVLMLGCALFSARVAGRDRRPVRGA